jgi:hypothetical protein
MPKMGEILEKREGVDPYPKDNDGLDAKDPSLH